MISVAIAAAPPVAAEQTLKQQMGENFAVLQSILAALVTANYASVPGQAAVLRDHAVQLTEAVPAGLSADQRDRFLGLALSLKSNSESLASIAQLLASRDQEKEAKSELLGVDALRESLAGHYGGVVVTCVACHNQFRRQAVK